MSRSLRDINVFPITTRHLEVIRVADVTPGMRRVTLGGPELAAHTAANGMPVASFRSDGFDDEFKIILTHPDAPAHVGPTQDDGILNWPRTDPHLLLRTYTVRRWDADAGEIDVDFVNHGTGPATSWAYRVQPGEHVQVAGPKSSSGHPSEVDWTLVAADETALPAVGRWLEEWPAGARGQVFVEVADPSHRQDLPVPDGVELTWLTRDGAEAGTTSLLFDALRAADWWDGRVFAFVAGEAGTLVPIRRWLKNEKQLPRDQVEVTGYWRRQEVVLSAAGDGSVDLEATEDQAEKFHELCELLPPFALRVAASIGLADAFDSGTKTVDQLMRATGAHRVGLGKLLRYLAVMGIVEPIEGAEPRYALTALGRELEDEHAEDELRLDGVHARRELGGALSLLEAVRSGSGDFARWFGEDHAHQRAHDPALVKVRIRDEAEVVDYVSGALASSSQFDGTGSVIVHGRAPGGFAHALVGAHADLRATVLATPAEVDVLTEVHPAHDRVAFAATGPFGLPPQSVDAVLLTEALAGRSDTDATTLLTQAAAFVKHSPTGRVLVFGDVLDPVLAHEHDYEDDLFNFALTGGGLRDDAEHRALFTAAGLTVASRQTIGWGLTLYALSAPPA